jgi:protein involved in polysaccharide export with SLBB domain
VTITGEVSKPGFYPVKRRDSRRVLDWLREAVVKPSADLSRVQLTRRKETRLLNINDINNVVVLRGDEIFIPALNSIRVVGAVRKPGVVYFSTEQISILAAIERAGFLPETDSANVQIIRANNEVTSINLAGEIMGTHPRTYLQPGDLVFVPIRKEQPFVSIREEQPSVTVFGRVNRPGVFKLTKPKKLSDLLQEVGAIDNDEADLENVEVTFTDKTTKRVNVLKLLREADETQDVLLKGGERVYVPTLSPRKNSIYVMGAVARPGVYKYEKGITLYQSTLLAGGTVKYDKQEVSIMRMNPQTKKVEQLNFDFQKIKRGEVEDPLLQPGDVVYIGEGRPPSN